MHIFLSDAHIRKDSSYRGEKLMRFLSEIKPELTHLYILGDLFEFWFEYHRVFPKHYFKILSTLYDLVQTGKTVHYILGNHEVMVGDFLKSFGFIIHRRDALLTINSNRVLLAHGHKIDDRPWTRIWHHLLTARINHALYRLVHPDIGVLLAQGVAHLSRKQRRSPSLVKKLEDFAAAKLDEIDVVILAHSHVPVIKEMNPGKYYLNTGDWIEHFSYVKFDRHGFTLNHY